MWPACVSNPWSLAFETYALSTALLGPTHSWSTIRPCHKINGLLASLNFQTIYQSYEDNGRLKMKGCVQQNPVYSWINFHLWWKVLTTGSAGWCLKAKTVCNSGLSKCNRVDPLSHQGSWAWTNDPIQETPLSHTEPTHFQSIPYLF